MQGPQTHLRRAAAALAASVALGLASTPAAAELNVALYKELLGEYTRTTTSTAGTQVDYAGLGRDPRWTQLLQNLEDSIPPTTGRAQLAFWINAYNLLAIRTVVDHYPLESIRDIGSFFSPVWKREAGRINSEPVTLDQIEHQILRKLGEPRIHAAIVCASTSCPSLAREPYTAEGLEEQLQASTQRWLDDSTKGLRIERSQGRVWLSPIFDWFSTDFEAAGGALAFASHYVSTEDRAWIRAHDPQMDYFDYDWSLNDWPRSQ